MQSKESIVASMPLNTHMMGKDDNDTHVVGKVWENTRMAGEYFDKGLILYDRRKMWWLMCFYIGRTFYVS